MFEKLFNYKSSTISSAALVVGSFTIFGASLSILRNALLASRFGAGSELDVYYAAFRIPDFVYSIFYLGVISVLFLPIFNDLYTRNKEEAWEFFGAMVNGILVVLGIIAVGAFFAAPVIVKLIVPGFSAEQIAVVSAMTRIMLLQPIVLGVSNIISGVLQSFDRFAAASLGHIAYNGGIIFGIIFLVPKWGVGGLAWAVLLGAVLHLLVQLPSFRRIRPGFKITLNLNFRIIRPHMRLLPPRIFNVISNQINIFAITILASTAISGSLAIFNLANDIQMLPQTVIAISLAVAAFPTLSRLAFHDKNEFSRVVNNLVKTIVFWLVPAGLFIIVFRAQVVRLILGYGNFGWEDTILTLNTLFVFGIGMVFQGIIPLLVRVFFALHNTVLPFISALASNVLTIGLGIYLLPDYGVMGLAMALVIANIAQVVILYSYLAFRRVVDAWLLVTRGLPVMALSAIAAGSGRLWLEFFETFFNNERVIGLALQTGFSVFAAFGTLVLLAKIFRVREFHDALLTVFSKFKK